ncbi:MAG: LysR family transcriptional regulator [Verrucomicrobiales bacterium]|nr:LysR family transcriptional regulator [Verrucomicrobiales bacterium]
MQIETLKVFCDLSETESFTKAAQINDITQSAVSQQIRSLENQFRATLIERSKKKFRLTREGQILYAHSKQIIQTYDTLRAQLQELRDVVSGTLRVATIYSIGLYDLPPYLKRFLKSHRTVNVHVEYHRSNRVYDDVLSNVCDVGLVAYAVKESRLEVVPLWRDNLVLVTSPKHPLANRGRISLSALSGERFISFEPDIPTRRAIDKSLRSEGVEVHHVMEVDNIETVKRAVEIELGVSIIPKSTVAQEVRNGTLSEVELDGADFWRPVSAIIKKSKVLSPAMKQFIAILREPKPSAESLDSLPEPTPTPLAVPAPRTAGAARPGPAPKRAASAPAI